MLILKKGSLGLRGELLSPSTSRTAVHQTWLPPLSSGAGNVSGYIRSSVPPASAVCLLRMLGRVLRISQCIGLLEYDLEDPKPLPITFIYMSLGDNTASHVITAVSATHLPRTRYGGHG